jgi:hypothetical protein
VISVLDLRLRNRVSNLNPATLAKSQYPWATFLLTGALTYQAVHPCVVYELEPASAGGLVSFCSRRDDVWLLGQHMARLAARMGVTVLI